MTSTLEKPHLLIIGCGYVGLEVLRQCLASRNCSHHPLIGTAGSTASLDKIRQLGARAIRLDLDKQPEIDLPTGRWSLLYMVPPGRQSNEDRRLARFLKVSTKKPPERVVYISTSGVYGDRKGNLVDEEDEIAPATERAQRRADAEGKIREFAAKHESAWLVLRVPGIYGPGRLRLPAIARGEPVLRVEDCGPGNRIHRDDLAACCLRALQTANCNRVINISDDEHATSCAFATEVARQAGLPAPPRITADEARQRFGAVRLSFLLESRLLDNTRMHRDLDVALRYPNMATGIAASLVDSKTEDAAAGFPEKSG